MNDIRSERRAIVHLSTVHPRTDTRIRVKETASLAAALNCRVSLVVQDGLGQEFDAVSDVKVVDVGLVGGGRLRRMMIGGWRIWRAVRKERPSVAHFHDPELILIGLVLKLTGIAVIYDVHEDTPRQILTKHWIPSWLRRPVSWGVAVIEWLAAKVLDSIVAATPQIAERFPAHKVEVIQNYPILDELVHSEAQPYMERPRAFAYIGSITRERGLWEMVLALTVIPADLGAKLELAGSFVPKLLENEVKDNQGWPRVRAHGWVRRNEVGLILGAVRAGLVLLHPNGRYEESYPVKMFEYMAAGLPVIASDFPLWRDIVGGTDCGLLVDPLDTQAIGSAMNWILVHPEEAEAMGRRGRQAVAERYNWESEAEKLVALYRWLLYNSAVAEEK